MPQGVANRHFKHRLRPITGAMRDCVAAVHRSHEPLLHKARRHFLELVRGLCGRDIGKI
jgi:hypothetical protein